jgi:hypothetical protein
LSCDYYQIYVDNICIAKYVTLDYAVIFVEAIFNKFYNETDLRVTIQKMNFNTEACDG